MKFLNFLKPSRSARLRKIVGSAMGELVITTLYALSSIIITTLILTAQDTYTFSDALVSNAQQGEMLIAAIAMAGPLAYSLVAEPSTIKWKVTFQAVLTLFTLFAISIYITTKTTNDINDTFLTTSSLAALFVGIGLHAFTVFSNHSAKLPGEKMKEESQNKIDEYEKRVKNRT